MVSNFDINIHKASATIAMHWLLLVEAPTMKAMKDLINHLTIALMNIFADKRPKFMLGAHVETKETPLYNSVKTDS